jgi:hypothetical protein
MVEGITSFDAIKYQTRYGENCTATKKDGVVTIQGDKFGERQMPLNEFMKVFLKEQPKVQLERTPQQDSVNFTGNENSGEPQENKKSNKTLWGLLGIGVLALGTFLLTRGRSGAKAVEEAAGKLGEEIAEPVLKATSKEATKAAETVAKEAETVTRPVTTKAPKAKAPKAEAPKAEAPKAEAPKAEAPKAKAPKAEAPKAEAPKAEAPKAEAPKAEAPKAEAPKAQASKAEAPKAKAPKAEAPKAEAPKAQASKAEAPKAEAPKAEAPKAEAPKAEASKVEEPTYNFAEQESQLSYATDEVPIERRGSYGQDIYDMFDTRNEMDMLSPHYKDPLSSSMYGSSDSFNSSFGF